LSFRFTIIILQLFIIVTNVFSKPDCDWSTFIKNQRKLKINSDCEATAIDVAFLGSENGTGESNYVLEELGVFNIGLNVIEDYTFSTASKMQRLNLDNNKISVIKVKAFSGLKSLRILSLRYNKITSLENATFNELFELQTLFLSNNNLRSFDFTILHRNMKLKLFALDSNNLTDFKNSQDSLKLNIEQLNFTNNLLTAFPLNNLPDLPNLRYLWIYSNALTEIEFDKIPLKFPNLQKFAFQFNQWNCCYLIKMIKKLKEMLPEIIIEEEYSGNLQDLQFEQVSNYVKCPHTSENRIQIIKLENELKEQKISLDRMTSLESELKKQIFNHTIFLSLFFCVVICLLLVAFFGLFIAHKKINELKSETAENRNFNYDNMEQTSEETVGF
jgi:hypothetical protein